MQTQTPTVIAGKIFGLAEPRETTTNDRSHPPTTNKKATGKAIQSKETLSKKEANA